MPAIRFGACAGVTPTHYDILVEVVQTLGGNKHDAAYRGIEGVCKGTFYSGALYGQAVDHEVGQQETVARLVCLEIKTGSGIVAGQNQFKRGRGIELALAEGLKLRIAGLKAETFYYLAHKVGAGKGLHLVVDGVAVGAEAGAAGELGQVAHSHFLAGLVQDYLLRPAKGVRSPVQVKHCQQETYNDG